MDKLEIPEAAVEAGHKAMMAELFIICQPDHGSVFSFIDDHPELIKIAVEAMLPHIPDRGYAEVGVKALEWYEHSGTNLTTTYDALLYYRVSKPTNADVYRWSHDGNGPFSDCFASLSEAKAAAQADYAARIRSALIATPSPIEDVAGPSEALPPATPSQAAVGWTLDVDYLDKVRAEMLEATGYDATIECVEFCLLLAARRVRPSPVDESSAPKRWLIEETLPSGSIRWSVVEHEYDARSQASMCLAPATVTALYASPVDEDARDGVLPVAGTVLPGELNLVARDAARRAIKEAMPSLHENNLHIADDAVVAYLTAVIQSQRKGQE